MIERHQISRKIEDELIFLKENFDKEQNRLTKRINKNLPVNLWAYKRTGIDIANLSLVVDNSDDESFKAGLDYYLELGLRHFQREFTDDLTLNANIGEVEFEINTTNKRENTSLFNWYEILNASIITKNHKFKDEIISLYGKVVKEDNDLFWNKSVKLLLMCLNIIEFEDSIILDIIETVNSGMVSYQGVEESGLVFSKEGQEIREKIWFPVMNLFYLAFKGDSKEFNDNLKNYLLFKKQWIIENNEHDNSHYWIDFPLLSCCSYACENGIVISTMSDYIPQIAYKGVSDKV